MDGKIIRRYVDLAMFFTGCFLLATGLVMEFRLIPGYRGGEGFTMLGLDRHQWGWAHFGAGCVFVVLVAIHVFLNWSFVKRVIASNSSLALLLFALIGLLILMLFLAAPIHKGQEGRGRRGGSSARVRTRETGILLSEACCIRVNLLSRPVPLHSSQYTRPVK